MTRWRSGRGSCSASSGAPAECAVRRQDADLEHLRWHGSPREHRMRSPRFGALAGPFRAEELRYPVRFATPADIRRVCRSAQPPSPAREPLKIANCTWARYRRRQHRRPLRHARRRLGASSERRKLIPRQHAVLVGVEERPQRPKLGVVGAEPVRPHRRAQRLAARRAVRVGRLAASVGRRGAPPSARGPLGRRVAWKTTSSAGSARSSAAVGRSSVVLDVEARDAAEAGAEEDDASRRGSRPPPARRRARAPRSRGAGSCRRGRSRRRRARGRSAPSRARARRA